MKSSKKFMTKVLTAALVLSMMAGTGVCAAAVDEEPIDDEPVVIAPADENDDLSDRLTALKEMLSEAAQTAYVRLSQTTLARLMVVNQKVKAANDIMVNAYAQDAELKTNFANQLIQIGEDAEKLIASADNDEEFEAQIMAAVQEKVEKLTAEVEAQSAENMAAAQAESDALLAEANAELEAIKAELQDKKTRAAKALKAKVDAIQQQIDAVKAQAEAAAQQAKEALDQTAIVKLLKAQLKTKMAEKIMEEAEIQDAQIKAAVAEQVAQIRAETDALIASLGDDEELIAGIQEQIDQKLEQLSEDASAELEQMWADAEEAAAALLADAEALKAEGQAQVSEEVAAFREMLVQKAAEVQAEVDALKAQMADKVAAAKAKVEQYAAEIWNRISSMATKLTDVAEGEFEYMVYSNCLTHEVAATLTGYTGEETELDVPAYTEGGIPVVGVSFASETDITTLNLPATVRSVDGISFLNFPALEAINIDEDNENYQSIDGVVFDKDGCCICAVPPAKEFNAPEGVTAIKYYAYFGSQMEEITLPSTLECIDSFAFMDCANLTKIEIPASVTSIGYDAFVGTAEGFTIYCYAGSLAETYAVTNNINYVLLDAEEEDFYLDVSIVYEDENAYEDNVMALGTSVTFKAEGVNGVGDCTYSCYYRKVGDEKWTVKQGMKTHSAANEFSLTPKTAGDYEVCVKVIDSEGTLKKIYHEFTVSAEPTGSYISADTVRLGEQVTLHAEAKEGCTYAFYFKREDIDVWTVKQNFAENNEVAITPEHLGYYDVCIKTKNADGQISKEYFTFAVSEIV